MAEAIGTALLPIIPPLTERHRRPCSTPSPRFRRKRRSGWSSRRHVAVLGPIVAVVGTLTTADRRCCRHHEARPGVAAVQGLR
jgi:hypothetical protein